MPAVGLALQTGPTPVLLARDPAMGIRGDRIAWMPAGVIGGEERPEPLTRTMVTSEVVGTGHGDG